MRLFFLFSILVTVQLTTFAQSAKVETLIRHEMSERRIPGVQVAVVKDGKIVLSKAFGVADVEQVVPAAQQLKKLNP